ncbi:DUF6069 family protein [Rhodococcus sp. NPDC058505]|uniref:DUF6069 family protein n=1 Tax=unclassified Rhodococcus (in: high G+C Gram-positive bacteria) TaxID=192944 RepID=UPI003655FA74
MTGYPGTGGGPSAGERTLSAAKFWPGAAATALVTALSGLVVTLIVRAFGLDPLAPPWLPELTLSVRFAVLGFIAALLAAVLLYLLELSTPGGESFFGWIVGLLVVASVILPFVYDATAGDRVATALVHLSLGVPILGLLPGVARRALVWR